MQCLKATEILDISTYGTASTKLARKWQNANLIDTTTVVLEKVLNNPDIMSALEKIEDFRNFRDNLTKTINREKAVHEAKKQRAEERREVTTEEKKEETKRRRNDLFLRKTSRKITQVCLTYPSSYVPYSLPRTSINWCNPQHWARIIHKSNRSVGGRLVHDDNEDIGLFDTVVTRSQADEIIEAEIL